MKRIGLCLSGGGARGFFHCGLLHALRNEGIQPDIISGTSAGAIAGSLFAAGLDMKTVIDNFPSRMNLRFYNPMALFRSKWAPQGLLREFLETYLKGYDFSDLEIPLIINAVDIKDGELSSFSTGSVIDAVIAASSIPGLLTSPEIKGSTYLDGGLIKNLPAYLIRDKCDLLIGINLMPFRKTTANKMKRTRLMYRAIEVVHLHNNLDQEKMCDIVISPLALNRFVTYDFSKKEDLFKLGIKEGQQLIQQLV
jgi:NTE family protein